MHSFVTNAACNIKGFVSGSYSPWPSELSTTSGTRSLELLLWWSRSADHPMPLSSHHVGMCVRVCAYIRDEKWDKLGFWANCYCMPKLLFYSLAAQISYLFWARWGSGTGCPGRWWSHRSWRFSRPMLMCDWGMWLVGMVMAGWQLNKVNIMVLPALIIQGSDSSGKVLPGAFCCHQVVGTGEVCSTAEWGVVQSDVLVLRCFVLLTTKLVEVGQMQLLHTCFYSSFCQPTAGLLCSQCPAMARSSCQHWHLYCSTASHLYWTNLTQKGGYFLIYLSLLLVVMQLSSHDLVLATSGQSEVWIESVGPWWLQFEWGWATMEWYSDSVFLSHPGLFWQFRACFSQGRECFPLCICALPS